MMDLKVAWGKEQSWHCEKTPLWDPKIMCWSTQEEKVACCIILHLKKLYAIKHFVERILSNKVRWWCENSQMDEIVSNNIDIKYRSYKDF